VAGPEYARLNTGGSIIRGNSGNGALPILNGKNVGNKNVAPNDRASVGLPCPSTQAEMALTSKANRCFEFDKRRQLLIGTHDEPLSVVPMRVSNPDCSAFAVQS